MKIFLIGIIFLQFTNIIVSIIPVWNFDSSTQNLLNSEGKYEYAINEGTVWADQNNDGQNDKFILKRRFYRENGKIKQENKLYINNEFFGFTEYDDIESMYRHNDPHSYYICPKGRYHVYYYNLRDNTNYTLTNFTLQFSENDTWDLKCYHQVHEDYLFISYQNINTNLYQFDIKYHKYIGKKRIQEGIFAYSWEVGNQNDPVKKMFAIIQNYNNNLELNYYFIYVKRDNKNEPFNYESLGNGYNLTSHKSKHKACFTRDDLPAYYYFINYNNAKDFESGFCENEITTDNINTEQLIKKVNNNTPFIFYENITINEIKFIYFSKYIYYNISIQNTNKFYYGIIDIKLNKILFNTNETILDFKPYDSNSMLAITKDSAYRICPIANGYQCIESCNNGLVIDSTKGNYCGDKCEDNTFTLIPDNICVEKCDEKLYIIDNNTRECRLCKDIEGNIAKFKLTNFDDIKCLEEKPKHSYYMNEDLYLVACYKGFNYYENNDCVEKCSKGFFHEKNKHLCKKCFNNCKTCSEGEEENSIKCLSCDKNSNYTFLYNNTCIESCPENFTISKNNECILIENKNKEKILSLFIVITALLLIINLFFFYKRIFCKVKKDDLYLINEISCELIENKEL